MSKKSKIAIAGFGQEGKALYEYFRKTHEVQIFEGKPGATLTIPANFPVVYKSPGIPLNKLKLASRRTEISSLTNLFFQKTKGVIVGVTGTKGKSTTAALIHHILSDAGLDTVLIGNIGNIGLEFLKTDHKYRVYVYELSSFQLELLNKSPRVAVVTSIFQDHLDHHRTLAAYTKAKQNVTKFQKPADFLVISSGIDPKLFKTKGQKFTVSPGPDFKCKTKLVGRHNLSNILLAYTVADIFDLPKEQIIHSIATFKPLPGRLEKIATKKNGAYTIAFYDDALATIPQATWEAIQALPNIDTIILGGQDRGINFEEFAKLLPTAKIKNFIIFPETGAKMVKYLPRARRILPAKNMQEAIVLAYRYTKTGCLLSAGSPSFNMFKNYADRSAQYRYWITKLSK